MKTTKITDLMPKLEEEEKLKQLLKDRPAVMETRKILIHNGNVVGGSTRLRALYQLGYTDIPEEWIERLSDADMRKVERLFDH